MSTFSSSFLCKALQDTNFDAARNLSFPSLLQHRAQAVSCMCVSAEKESSLSRSERSSKREPFAKKISPLKYFILLAQLERGGVDIKFERGGGVLKIERGGAEN